MLRKISTIAFLYIKTTYASRTTLIFSIAMPLLFTFVIGQAMQGFAPGTPAESWPLLVADADESDLSANLLARLEANPAVRVEMTDRDTALAALEADEAIAALVIPAGFGEGLASGGSADLEFHQNVDRLTRAQILAQAVDAASAELSGSLAIAELSARVAENVGLFEGASPEAQASYQRAAFTEAESEWASGAPVAVQTKAVTRLEDAPDVPLGAAQSSPGMLVMYALFFTFGGGTTLLAERDEGTLRRLLVMPMHKGTMMTGKLLGIFLGALIQMGIMIVAGQFVFNVSWGQSPAALTLLLLAYGFAGTTLGLMVAALARTLAQANAMSTIVVMALASLGGAWWPIEIVPAWMRQLALALPTGWAMRGFHDIITRGLGVSAVLLETGVLAAFGLAFLLIGVWRFRYE